MKFNNITILIPERTRSSFNENFSPSPRKFSLLLFFGLFGFFSIAILKVNMSAWFMEETEKIDFPINSSLANVPVDTIILYENRINRLSLPFSSKEVYKEIQQKFRKCEVDKDLYFDPQTGDEFFVYYLISAGNYLGEFQMYDADTLKLFQFVSESPYVKDQYEIKVGDPFEKIAKCRSGKFTVNHNYYGSTKVEFSGSKIRYEISGSSVQIDPPPLPPVPEDQEMKDWKVTAVIWAYN